MKLNLNSKKLLSYKGVAITYFIVCSAYIIFSDRFLLFFFDGKISINTLSEIQSYKGLFFVLSSSLLIYFALRKREKILEKYTNTIKKSQKQYQDLYTNMTHGVIYATPEGLVTSVNESTLTILGITKEEMIGKSIFDDSWKPISNDGEIIEIYENPAKRALRNKEPIRNNILGAINVKTGLYVWLKLNVIPEFENGDEEPFRVCITIDDITQLKNYQQELEESKKQINESLKKTQFNEFLLKEASKMTKIGVYEIYPETQQTYFSEELLGLFGISEKEEFSLERIPEIIPEKYLSILQKSAKECMEDGLVVDEEFELILGKDKKYWVRTIVKPIIEKGKIIGRRGVVQDITEFKNAHLELEKSLELLEKSEYSIREAGRMAKIGYWSFDKEKDLAYWSDEIHKIYGTNPKDVLPKFDVILNFFTENSRKQLLKATLELDLKGTPFELELNLINANNENIWIRNLGQPLYNEQNEIIGRRGVSQDISIEKNAQLALLQAKENLEKRQYTMNQASKLAKIGYWYYDFTTKELTWSDYIYRLYNLTPEDNIPSYDVAKTYFDEESQEKITKATEDLHEHGISYDLELRMINSNNEELWVRNVVHPVYNKNKEIIGKTGVIQNITEVKHARLEILKAKEQAEINEAKFKSYAEKSPVAIYTTDLEGDCKYVNETWLKMAGMSKEEALGKGWLKALHPDDLEQVKTNWYKSVSTEGKWSFEYRFVNKISKEITWVEGTAKELFNDKNELVGYLGSNVNITERKIAKEKIEASELKFKLYAEKSPFVIFTKDTDGKCNYLNEAWVEMSGMSIAESLGKKWMKALHPDDVDLVNENWLKSVESKGKFKFEYRYIHQKDKRIVWVESSAKEMRNEKNELLGYIGTIINITERKIAEEEKTRFQQTIENSLNEIYVFDAETYKFSYVNQGASFNLGYTIEEIKKLTPIEIKPEFTIASFNELVAPLKANELEKIIFFTNHKRKDGSLYPAEVHLQLIREQNNNRFLAIVLDLTERKEAERMYRLLADNTNDIITLQETNSILKYISPSVETMLGFKPNELANTKFYEIIYEEDKKYVKETIAKEVLNGKSLNGLTFRVKHKQGHLIWLETSISPINKGSKIVSFVASNRDVTQWMEAKKEIEDYQFSLQKLTSEISLIEEKQKKEIAANIHDHLSQSLVISKMRITDLEKKDGQKNIKEDLEFIKKHISDALENSRKITYDLSPPVLYQLGLIDAVDWFADETKEKYGIDFQFNTNEDHIDLTEFKSILLFRCIQEAVTNTIKYAEASLITLNLEKDAETVTIVYTDNGKGFDTSKLKNNVNSGSGFGLFAVKERIRNMNGKLEITSEINIGTKIKICVPLD